MGITGYRLVAGGLAIALASAPALAQDTAGAPPTGAWAFAASVYAWLPAMSSSVGTPLGTVDADMSSSDAIGNLEFAFMGAFEARRDRWALVGDLVYSDISVREPTPFGLLYSHATLDTEMTLFSGYALYRVHDSDTLALDIGGGFRAISLDLDLHLDAELARRDRSFDGSSTWVEPLVAARAIVPLSGKWFATAYADWGGSDGGDRTWQVLSSVGYHFDDRWSAQLAYRYLSIEKEIDSLDTSIDLYGPILGATYHF